MDVHQDSEPGDGDADRDHGEEEAVAKTIGQDCDQHAETESASPRWDRVQLGLNVAVSVGLDDCRGEVRIAIS
jgi:hypothetical protein